MNYLVVPGWMSYDPPCLIRYQRKTETRAIGITMVLGKVYLSGRPRDHKRPQWYNGRVYADFTAPDDTTAIELAKPLMDVCHECRQARTAQENTHAKAMVALDEGAAARIRGAVEALRLKTRVTA